MKYLSKFYIALIFLILYAPIIVVILFSFNGSGSLSRFSGFTFHWYAELFRDGEALKALKNSLILAVLSSLLATVLGTLCAFAINRAKRKWFSRAVETVTNIPMMNPDIVTGVSMMLLFVFVGTLIGATEDKLNFWTLFIAHVTFNLPYVILNVSPKLRQMDRNLPEAALDLGCTPLQSFFKVELPAILPGVLSGLIMAFTLSLDDFVISYFTSGSDFQTLPILIYSMTKKEVKPDIYALSTLIIITILVLLLLSNFIGSRSDAHGKSKKAKKEAGN